MLNIKKYWVSGFENSAPVDLAKTDDYYEALMCARRAAKTMRNDDISLSELVPTYEDDEFAGYDLDDKPWDYTFRTDHSEPLPRIAWEDLDDPTGDNTHIVSVCTATDAERTLDENVACAVEKICSMLPEGLKCLESEQEELEYVLREIFKDRSRA